MKRTAIFFCLLMSSMLAYASDENVDLNQDQKECTQWCHPYWKSMPREEYVFFAAEAADCSTTLDIKNHANLEESNPVLGTHPSQSKIIGFCVAAGLLHSAITYELVDQGVPRGLIKAWEYVSIGVEAGFAVHNYSLGLRFRF